MINKESPADILADDCRWLEKLFAKKNTHPKLVDAPVPQGLFSREAARLTFRQRSGLLPFVMNGHHKMMSLFVLSGQMLLVADWRKNKGHSAYYDKALNAASQIVTTILPADKLAARGVFSTMNIACQMTQIALEDNISLTDFTRNVGDYFQQTHEYHNVKNYLPQQTA